MQVGAAPATTFTYAPTDQLISETVGSTTIDDQDDPAGELTQSAVAFDAGITTSRPST